METKTPTSSYHHQRAPRTPESYFNVPESIALLNIVKSERIQSAFQSNRKNHASVWEMVAEVLNRFSARKRSAKQCCNRYENLKKIYTQLKKNPERHVRRNWPYMFLFKEIEEQRGECWGSTSKRLNLLTKNSHHHHHQHHGSDLSYYQRRRQAVELSTLINAQKDLSAVAQHNLLQSLAHSNDSSSNASKMERFLPNHFVEAQLTEGSVDLAFDEQPATPASSSNTQNSTPATATAAVTATSAAAAAVAGNSNALHLQQMTPATILNGGNSLSNGIGLSIRKELQNGCYNGGNSLNVNSPASILEAAAAVAAAAMANGMDARTAKENFDKDCNGALNLQANENNISLKSEPLSEGEFNPDDIQLMQTNYNGSQSYYPHDINPSILQPDVIVDTDNISSSSSVVSLKSKRKLSSSTDGDSTNYELIEYLKRREKRDEELLKRMDAREERLLNLLERTVVAIETLAASTTTKIESSKVQNEEKENNNKISANAETLSKEQCMETPPSEKVTEEESTNNKVTTLPTVQEV